MTHTPSLHIVLDNSFCSILIYFIIYVGYTFSGVKSGQVLLTADFEADGDNIGVKPISADSSNKEQAGRPGRKSGSLAGNPGVSDQLAVLHVDLIKAKDLIKADMIGKSDPYAVLKCGKQTDKTKVVNNSQNPQWDHSSDFDVNLADKANLM